MNSRRFTKHSKKIKKPARFLPHGFLLPFPRNLTNKFLTVPMAVISVPIITTAVVTMVPAPAVIRMSPTPAKADRNNRHWRTNRGRINHRSGRGTDNGRRGDHRGGSHNGSRRSHWSRSHRCARRVNSLRRIIIYRRRSIIGWMSDGFAHDRSNRQTTQHASRNRRAWARLGRLHLAADQR